MRLAPVGAHGGTLSAVIQPRSTWTDGYDRLNPGDTVTALRFLNRGTLFVVIPTVLLSATLHLPAQETQPASGPAEATKEAPVAIPADEIPQKSSQDEVELQQIRLSLGTRDQGAEEIQADLPPVADAIRQLE